MKRYQHTRPWTSAVVGGLVLLMKTAGIVIWGVLATVTMTALTGICVLLLFAPPFVFMVALCVRGLALSAASFRRSITCVENEWHALASGLTGPGGGHAHAAH